MNGYLRTGLIVVAIAIVGWFSYQIYRAGGDVPPASSDSGTRLKLGHAEGERLNFKSWSLDYDKITTTGDTAIVELENVHDGRYFKNGKPYMTMRAGHVVVNRQSNDFTVTQKIDLKEVDGKHDRQFTSASASYHGYNQTLVLTEPAIIRSDGAILHVKSATFDFKSGDIKLSSLVGTK